MSMSYPTTRRFLTTDRDWRRYTDESCDIVIRIGFLVPGNPTGVTGRIRETIYRDGSRELAHGDGTAEPITRAEADRLFAATDSRWLRKQRSYVVLPLGDTVTLDRFQSIRGTRVHGLTISRIDPTLNEPPAWIGNEITGRTRWSDRSLCRFGTPMALSHCL